MTPMRNGNYLDFLKRKRITYPSLGLEGPHDINPKLFEFQRDITSWALRKGRAAIWADCGLGKSWMALEWSRIIHEREHGKVLILTPLAVAEQFVDEGHKLGIDVTRCYESADVRDGINVTNYDRLHRFDPSAFVAVVLDESSCLKDYTSKTRNTLIESFEETPYRLACTATPSPNDYMELGNHAEFLGAMSRSEMLSMFFVHDGGETQKWRLKRHAATDYWAWVCSWAVSLRMPSDLGYDDAAYQLPPLEMHQHVVHCNGSVAADMGLLFLTEARGLTEQRAARRSSVAARAEKVAALANATDRPFLVWCDLNAESSAATKLIPDAVEIRGSDTIEHKERTMNAFRAGELRVLVTKPSIAGWGVNWQHCADVAFLGLSNSFEAWYQAVRRTWRFGQERHVNCHLVTSDAEGAVVSNLARKQRNAESMSLEMSRQTKEILTTELHTPMSRTQAEYDPGVTMKGIDGTKRNRGRVLEEAHGNGFAIWRGDCVEALAGIDDDEIDYSIFSPPFASLYTYSNSDRDMGNTKTHSEFFEHFGHLIPELLRVTKPGRLVSFHCMNLPTSKTRDGVIGLTDFRGQLIAAFSDAGWIYHSEVCIWKDPVTAMQRTKALGLLHKQIRKDSAMSRQGIADYLVTMRKPGENPEPIAHESADFPVSKWQRYASPIWTDINPSDTLQRTSAREHDDEKHIAPLQLTVIRRALEIWTNPGDLVLSPFMGIGSEGFVALDMERRFVGIELKKSYFDQAAANLKTARRQLVAAL